MEVGAIPSHDALLASKFLNSVHEKIGINLAEPSEFKDFQIIKGNANRMDVFDNETFDCILCNSILEHDKYFWKTISEIRRILKKGGLLIIGTPSYTNFKFQKLFQKFNRFVKGELISNFFATTTICYKIHDYPGDYYRYSEQTFKDVFFDGFRAPTPI